MCLRGPQIEFLQILCCFPLAHFQNCKILYIYFSTLALQFPHLFSSCYFKYLNCNRTTSSRLGMLSEQCFNVCASEMQISGLPPTLLQQVWDLTCMRCPLPPEICSLNQFLRDFIGILKIENPPQGSTMPLHLLQWMTFLEFMRIWCFTSTAHSLNSHGDCLRVDVMCYCVTFTPHWAAY